MRREKKRWMRIENEHRQDRRPHGPEECTKRNSNQGVQDIISLYV